eukprot:gene26714-27526_t
MVDVDDDRPGDGRAWRTVAHMLPVGPRLPPCAHAFHIAALAVEWARWKAEDAELTEPFVANPGLLAACPAARRGARKAP